MKIKKLGHCCLVVETNGKRVMTDPGSYSTLQDQETNIDIILITHEHPDHYHLESLRKVMANNPQAIIVTNSAVGKLLEVENIKYEKVEHGEVHRIGEVLIEGYGELHAEIYRTWNSVQNTGYFIAEKLFYPGDAFYDPKKPIDILALPVAGPWMKIGEAVDYALLLKPRVAFPVHDGMLKFVGPVHRLPGFVLLDRGIKFIPMNEGDEHGFF
jgi:L-ascorbate metabolism protein UlaG (beta-lactamase superfamily)